LPPPETGGKKAEGEKNASSFAASKSEEKVFTAEHGDEISLSH
jgi:hypothetical protein